MSRDGSDRMSVYHLATVFPFVRRVRIPVTRDQAMLLMVAVNEIFLAIDIYLAHSISGTIVPYEWIPIIFGISAGSLLIIAGLISLRSRPIASFIAAVTLTASIVVGILGWYFHLMRAIVPAGLPGDVVSIPLLVWAPPIVAPLTFSLVGLLGIAAIWTEDPPESGIQRLLKGARVQLPLNKTQAYFLMVGLGILACVISSVLDHARAGFDNIWLWVPSATGVFGAITAAALGFIRKPSRADLVTFVVAMILLIATGVTGAYLHVISDLTAQGTVVIERFIRGAPFLAPLLFADMGGLGFIVLLSSDESGST